MSRLYRLALLVAIVLGGCASSSSQAVVDGVVGDSIFIAAYDFVNVKADTIIDNGGAMRPFYEALNGIKGAGEGEIRTVPIVHYGDSHIQAGFMTKIIMRHLAHDFGNAGRGMVVPHKLGGKNEPFDYSITSPTAHSGATVIATNGMSIGVSGASIMGDAPTRYNISINYNELDTIDYSFSRIVVFHDSLAPMITTVDSRMVDDGGGSDIFRPFMTEINLVKPTDSVSLRTYREGQFNRGPVYGFSLENSRSGVLYHSMGVNGACFLHWGRSSGVAAQCAALAPSLIIVSLGSNEAAGSNFVSSVFTREMDSFVSKLKRENPTAAILLTTSPEAMRVRGGKATPNANFKSVQDAILSYGAANNIAVIDLYGITSGAGSAQQWKDNGLLARDGIHYTIEGYKLQGLLIYKAIKRGFFRHK